MYIDNVSKKRGTHLMVCFSLCTQHTLCCNWINMPLRFTHRKSVSICLSQHTSTHTHTLSPAHTHMHIMINVACVYVREKDVLSLSLCLNEPWHPAPIAPHRSARLKLERLTGADGPTRSQEWKYHYTINRGCSRMDHSLTTNINMAVYLCVRDILKAVPLLYYTAANRSPCRDNKCFSE